MSKERKVTKKLAQGRQAEPRLYVAYGSNLNLRQMAVRCPNAIPYGVAQLKDYQLTFRGVATLEPLPSAVTPVGVWQMTDGCEVALDRYEGFPRLYRKELVELTLTPAGESEPKRITAMVYLMNHGMPAMPSKWYLDAIAQGYEDVGLDTIHLTKALEHTKSKMRGDNL